MKGMIIGIVLGTSLATGINILAAEKIRSAWFMTMQ